MTAAVVFAYHNVGVRCLEVLRAQDVRVPLVVTHRDAPGETLWFGSVAAAAARHGIETAAPTDPNQPDFIARVRALEPDFLFSFYYRLLLAPALLAAPRRGAFNMHGSLLPKYRGRAPVNWAIVKGERETGATLHEMVAKPDAGRIVDQQAVPILPDDTAREVMDKVTVAAEIVLDRALPRLIAGTAALRPQDLAGGSYFRGRRPADGRIDWTRPAREIHDLVRAVAPPYPGAFGDLRGKTLRVLRTRHAASARAIPGAPTLLAEDDRLYLRCADGGLLQVLEAELDGAPLRAADLPARLGALSIPLLG